ncbi:MAG: hypothetical protein F7C35_08935 [Desulfurococcales archaeon]|nr:hypothetical protein [Desulfurococcales archaeon]
MKLFKELCEKAGEAGFELLQGDIRSNDAITKSYRDYPASGYSVRFILGDLVVPSIELKTAHTTLHRYSLNNSIIVIVNNIYRTRISRQSYK